MWGKACELVLEEALMLHQICGSDSSSKVDYVQDAISRGHFQNNVSSFSFPSFSPFTNFANHIGVVLSNDLLDIRKGYRYRRLSY
jgi:hypothetical protein